MRSLTLIPTLCCSLTLLASLGCDLDSKSVGDPEPPAGSGTDTDSETDADTDATTGADTGMPEGPEAMCIAANLPADGHGWDSDLEDVACPQPPEGPPVECPDPIDTLEQECTDAGLPCDHETMITRDAALCIATEYGLAAGVEPWRGHLLYHHGVGGPVWVVTSTSVAVECMEQGDDLVIDAQTGGVLMEQQWMSVC